MRRIALAGASLLVAALAVVAPALPAAAAGTPTTIAFESSDQTTVAFTERWVLTLRLTGNFEDLNDPLKPTSGTVDVLVTGIGGIFAADLPIQEDGRVFVTQPVAGPRLGAGSHEFTALFTPAQGQYLAPSQTAAPAVLTIEPLSVSTKVTAEIDPAVAKYPFITATLGGEYVTETGGTPPGSWEFVVTEEGESEPAFEAVVAQESGEKEPIRVEIRSKLDDGATYTVEGVFTPSDELAPGLEIASGAQASFTTPGASLSDALTTRVPFPWWIVVALGVFLIGLVATVVILGVKLSRRPDNAERKAARPPVIPGDPGTVELMTLDDAGIEELGSREPQSWSLSADNDTEVLATDEPSGADGAVTDASGGDSATKA